MKILIVGAGGIGETHIKTLRKFDGIQIAICDTKPENLERFGTAYHIGERYTDYKQALTEGSFDAVIVCTPNHLHECVTVFALEHGCNVLCEKPMAATVEQAQRMLDASRKTGKKLMIAYIVREYEGLKRLKALLDKETLGKIISARCLLATPETLDIATTTYRKSFETGGGIIYDYTHELDYCRYLFGQPDAGFCFSNCALKPDLTVDDNAEIQIRFVSGVTLQVHMDYIQRTGRGACGRTIEIVGEKGFAACDFKTLDINYYDGREERFDLDYDWVNNFKNQFQTFLDICEGKDRSYVSGEDGLAVLNMANRLYESAHTENAIKF